MTDVMVGIASIPERIGSLEQVVASLSPQADRIVVSLNDYTEIPGFLAGYSNVEPVLTGLVNLGDGEKFRAVDEWDGVVVTCDDDIGYSADYVARLIEGLEVHGSRCGVGFHGGTTLGWNGSAVAASHKRVRCLGTLEEDDTDINVLGTGAMAYHAGGFPVWAGVFRHANMADVQMACHARTMGARFVGLSHQAGWLTDICPPLGQGRRIYNSNKSRDGSACDTHLLREEEIKRFDWLATPPARPKVRVSVGTCGRPDKLGELLQDLIRESRWVDMEVTVYEDPTPMEYGPQRRIVSEQGWGWVRFPRRLARPNYWRLVDRQLSDTKRSGAEWFLFLPDDIRLVRHAIPKAISTWYRLVQPVTLTLWRLRSLEGLSNWTGMLPVQHAEASETFHVDGLYLCRREALETFDYRCQRAQVNGQTGSGVGGQLSRKLYRAGKRMYRVDHSLALNNDDAISIMNPAERLKHPCVTL